MKTSKHRNETIARHLISLVIILVVAAYSFLIIDHINIRTHSVPLKYFATAWAFTGTLLIIWNSKKQLKKQNNMQETYLFFDTETTGLPANFNAPVSDTDNWPRLVQLGWIITDDTGKHLKECEYIIKPDGFIIPDDAIAVHGISNERALKEGIDLINVLSMFFDNLSHANLAVAHNLSFDVNIVAAEFYRIGMFNPFSVIPGLCTKESGTMVCKIPRPDGNGYKWPSLKDLHTRLFGEYFEGAHSALADAKAAERCFWKMRNMGAI